MALRRWLQAAVAVAGLAVASAAMGQTGQPVSEGAVDAAAGPAEDAMAEVRALVANGDYRGLTRAFQQSYFDVNAEQPEGQTLLHLAAAADHPSIVRFLLELGANINARESRHRWTPLMVATYHGNRDVVRLLLTYRVDLMVVGSDNSTAYSLARFSGLNDLLALPQDSLGNRGDVNRLLAMAVEAGDARLAKQLLDLGASAEARLPSGWTPFHFAAARLNSELFTVLLRAAPNFPKRGARSGDGPSLAQAVLFGARASARGGEAVADYLNFLRSRGVDLRHTTGPLSNQDLAIKLGYGTKVASLFPAPVKVPEITMPAIELRPTMSKEDWKRTQRTLKALGLYDAAIDGVPGLKSHQGVYAYYEAFFDDLRRKAEPLCAYASGDAEISPDTPALSKHRGAFAGMVVRSAGSGETKHGYWCRIGLGSVKTLYLYSSGQLIADYDFGSINGDYRKYIYGKDDRDGTLFFIQRISNQNLDEFAGPNKFVRDGTTYLTAWGIPAR